MRVVLSADMEAISGLRELPELLACEPAYWRTGRRAMTDDVVAAAEGLLAGGADEVVLLDNHGSGHPENVIVEALPDRVRAETWNVFDLPAQGVDAMLQVGYHPPAGVAGFAPHSYIPGLRLAVDGVPIGESHGRIWAARTALLGITGHAAHERTLGPLAGVPYLVVQDGEDPHVAQPAFADRDTALAAIRDFAEAAMRGASGAPRPEPPADAELTADLDGATESQAAAMEAGGWERRGKESFAVALRTWEDANGPLAHAMGAAFAPFGDIVNLDLSSEEALGGQDPERLGRLTVAFREWVARMAAPAPAGT